LNTPAYPLSWPTQFPRNARREAGRFKTSLAAAMKNVDASLRLFASDSNKPLRELVISSNVTLGSSKPADPGVAIWFTWDNLQVCIPVDRYTTIEANLQAIHHIIEARRVELRHGTLALVRASFAGFLSLEHTQAGDWAGVLGVSRSAPTSEVRAAYQRLRSQYHTDRPTGDPDKFNAVLAAWDRYCREHHIQETN
jgi:hypothetical protein